MSWVCGNCSTNNDDEDEICFVCGAPRTDAVVPEVEDEPDESPSYIERPETSSHASDTGMRMDSYGAVPSYSDLMRRISSPSPPSDRVAPAAPRPAAPRPSPRRSRSRSSLRRSSLRFSVDRVPRIRICLFVSILVSLFVGIFILFYMYKVTGEVFLLSRFTVLGGHRDVKIELLAIILSCLAVISGLGLSLVIRRIGSESMLIRYCIAVAFYCAATIITPIFSAPLAFVFVAILRLSQIVGRGGRTFVVLFIVAMIFCAVGLPVMWAVFGDQHMVSFDLQGGSGDVDGVVLMSGDELPELEVPIRYGYTFAGYYDMEQGGVQYYDADMNALRSWDKDGGATLYARWVANTFEVVLKKQGGTGGASRIVVTFDSAMPVTSRPSRSGYVFEGYFDEPEGGTQYYDANMRSVRNWDKNEETTLYAHWSLASYG